ncbi:unnamed protein product [Amoebophrya sp. A120]|nr:unnamed protein product [Amoebophrya sp. A120]|eukprot:GSA120T00006874001.1
MVDGPEVLAGRPEVLATAAVDSVSSTPDIIQETSPQLATQKIMTAQKQQNGIVEQKQQMLVSNKEKLRSVEDAWIATLEKTKQSVVALKVTFLRSFNGDAPQTARATGFVVSENLILTNRHVVGSGPICATALFDQNEEIQVEAVYRDPVHDFGFLKFKQSDLRFTKVEPIELKPEALKPGIDIRVIGNDSGEKTQILSGIIGRIDRNCPHYCGQIMQDENTFYVGSASNTSGGSSGSPVINQDGHAVALNAGGATLSASAFYLPLDRVKRALELLVDKENNCSEIPRGTVCTSWKFSYFDAVSRLGVPDGVEKQVQTHQQAKNSPIFTGMLLTDNVMPESVSHQKLIPGDVLFKISDEIVADFVTLEQILDDNIGKELKFTIYRGKELLETSILVRSHEDFSPKSFAECGGGVFHNIPYSYGKTMAVNVENNGVWTAARGFVFGNKINSYCVLHAINDQKTTNLTEFVKEMRKIRHHERFSATWNKQMNAESRVVKTAGILMEREFIAGSITTWYMKEKNHCSDSDEWKTYTKKEENELFGGKIKKEDLKEQIEKPKGLKNLRHFWTALDRMPVWAQKVLPSLVLIEYRTPLGAEILEHNNRSVSTGVGIVVSYEKDNVIIACDRETVPQQMGLVQVEFAKILKVFAKIRFVHPVHNIVLLSVEKERLGDYPLPENYPLTWIDPYDEDLPDSDPRKEKAQIGDNVNFIGLTDRGDVTVQETALLSHFTPSYKLISPPVWRERNVTGFHLVDDLAGVIGGVCVTDEGHLVGIYCHFMSQADDYDKTKEWEYAMLPIYDYVKPLLVEIKDEDDKNAAKQEQDAESESELKRRKITTMKKKHKQPMKTAGNNNKKKTDDNCSEETAALTDEKQKKLYTTITEIPSLSCEFKPLSLSEAPHHGVNSEWISRLVEHSEANTQCLLVERITSGSCAEKHGFKIGDILVQFNEKVIVTVLHVEEELAKYKSSDIIIKDEENKKNKPEVILLRNGEELKKKIDLDFLPSDTATKLCIWNGLCLIPTPKAVRERGVRDQKKGMVDPKVDTTSSTTTAALVEKKQIPQIFCAKVVPGSPATAHELNSGFFLEKIDNHSLIGLNFEEFLDVLRTHFSTKSKDKAYFDSDSEEECGSGAACAEPSVSGGGSVGIIGEDKLAKMQLKKEGENKDNENNGTGVVSADDNMMTGVSYNHSFTRIMIRDLEGRENAKTIRRNDNFFPAFCITRSLKPDEPEYTREQL